MGMSKMVGLRRKSYRVMEVGKAFAARGITSVFLGHKDMFLILLTQNLS